MQAFRRLFSLIAAALVWSAIPVYASSHDFYAGKTIRFIVAFSPGGAFDAYTRTKERVQTLRKAFLETMKDPAFLADAAKGNMAIDPVPGEEIENVVAGLFKIDPKMIPKLKSMLVP